MTSTSFNSPRVGYIDRTAVVCNSIDANRSPTTSMMHRRLVAFLLVIISGAFLVLDPGAKAPTAVENIHVFSKLYGYVRFFHPSDEAASVDWDRFAVHGVQKVRGAETSEELRNRLRELFLPIAPTLQIYQTAEGTPPPHPALTPADTSGLELVAWQHKGIGLGTSAAYKSRRLNRITLETPNPSYAYLQQKFGAGLYRGRPIRLTARARADFSGGRGQAFVWMSEALTDGEQRVLGGPEPTIVDAAEWQTFTIQDTVSVTADTLAIGTSLMGSAKLWADAFVVETRTDEDGWQRVPLANTSFEEGAVGEVPPNWSGEGNGYRLSTVDSDELGSVGHIEWTGEPREVSEPLFDARPQRGEALQKRLGASLSVQLPVALYSRDGHTIGRVDADAQATLKAELEAIDLDGLTASDEALRLADVSIAWNILRHAYPYSDVVVLNWDELLTSTIRDALDDDGAEDFVVTLRRMVAALEDGHGSVGHRSIRDLAGLLMLPEVIDGRLVVTATPPDSPVQVGDIIQSIDGEPAMLRLEEAAALRSGSERWRRQIALRGFEMGPAGTSVELVVDRNGDEHSVEVERTQTGVIMEDRPPNVSEIEEDIYYVNLGRAEMAEISSHMDAISKADGVILDLRGYPNGNHQVLQHLSGGPLRSARWNIPQMIYPDHQNLAGYDTTGRWTLPPMEPLIQGKVVFLTNEKAISYAESVMGIVEHYKLGEIVGQPTAGTNGNINRILLPGGFTVVFTGMRVLKHDGSQHHLIGIRPTIPVERTIAGVREERDEYIDRAIQVIRSAQRE